MSRCTIPSKRRRKVTPPEGRPVVRIGAAEYNAIADIADATGRSLYDVTCRLLVSALEDVVIEYPDEVTDDD